MVRGWGYGGGGMGVVVGWGYGEGGVWLGKVWGRRGGDGVEVKGWKVKERYGGK